MHIRDPDLPQESNTGWLCCAIGAMLSLLFACGSSAPTDQVAPVPTSVTAAGATDPLTTRAPTTTSGSAPAGSDSTVSTGDRSPELILHNAQIITVDARFGVAEAVAITDGVISAVGTNDRVVPLAGRNTVLADLEGRTVLPGFVETHTHLMQHIAPDLGAMIAGHDELVAQGITTAGMPSVLPDQLEAFEKLDANGEIALRTHLYVAYNSVCGEPLGDFYLANPFSRDPDVRLALAGVKIFADGGVCGGPALSVPYLDSVPEALYNNGWVDNGQLYVSADEVTGVMQDVDAAGGQIVIHAIGDRAIATALEAIDKAGPLENPRQIHHNSWATLVDDDLLAVFGEAGLIPVVQMMPWARACEPGRTELWQSIVAPQALAVVEDRVAINRVNPGIRWAWHGDGPSIIGSPLQQMFSIVTQGSTDGTEICYPPAWSSFPTISVEEAIRWTTINAAAAMGFENDFGSIEVGKAGDLVVLEQDPLQLDAEIGLALNRPLATIIGGTVEFCTARLCRTLAGQEQTAAPVSSGRCLALDSVVAETEIGDGLYGWWPGDGDSDDLVGSNSGSAIDGAGFDAGVTDQGFALNGGAIELADPVQLDKGFTIETWVVFDGQNFDDFQTLFNNGHVFLRKNDRSEGNGFGVFVELDDQSLEPRAQSTSPPPVGAWIHVAATWDGTLLSLYVDGRLESQVERDGAIGDTVVVAQIGRGESGGTTYPRLFGRIDEFAIFQRSLSDVEIAAIFDAGAAGKCKF